MNRRTRLLIGAILLLAWPSSALAQPSPRIPRIGIISPASGPNPSTAALVLGLRELGYVERQNVAFELRWAAGRADRYPALAAELVRLKVDLIAVEGDAAGAKSVKQATRTIPIVALTIGDPVAAGLVASLARPGGNLTGLAIRDMDLSAKRLELLREILPKIARVAVLHDPAEPKEQVATTEAAGRALKLTLHVLEAGRRDNLMDAFSTAKREGAEALVVLASSGFDEQPRRLTRLAARSRLAAVYEHRRFTEYGGLMSCGPDILHMNRRAATYIDKILKGAKPADLPIEQPTKFELVINLRAAKALGLVFPQSVLGRADRILQ